MKFLINFLNLLTKKEKLNFFTLTLASIFNTFVELLSLGLVIPLIGLILEPNALISKFKEYFPSSNFESFIQYFEDKNHFIFFLIFFAFIYLIKNFLIFIFFNYQNKFTQQIEANFSKRIFKKYLFQNYSFFFENDSSDLTSKISIDVITFDRSFVGPLITFLSEFMIIIGIVFIIYFFGLFKVGLIFLFFFIIALILLKMIGSYSKIRGKSRKELDRNKLNLLKNVFANIKSIILDNKQVQKINQFQDISGKLAIIQKKIITITIIPKIIFEMIGIVAIVSVLYTLVEKNHSTTYIITVIGFLLQYLIELYHHFKS